MNQIASRDLHEYTDEVLLEVRDRQAEYVVTQEGKPIARLLPVSSQTQRSSAMKKKTAWARYTELADTLSRDWPKDLSSQEVLDEVRR